MAYIPPNGGGDAASGEQAQAAIQIGLGGAMFVALLIFTQIPGVLGFTVPVPLLAGMSQDLAHDQAGEYMVKMIAGVLGPAMAVGSPLGGWLADRFDRRGLLIVIGALFVASGVAPYFMNDPQWIVATRICVGIAAGALLTIGLTMIGDYLAEDKRAGMIGMLSAVNMLASLVILPAAGFLGDTGWRAAFLLYLLCAPVILLALPRSLPVPPKPAASADHSRRGWHADLPYGLILLALAAGISLTILAIYASYHFATIGLGKASTVGMLMMLNALIAAMSSSLFGKAAARYSLRMIFAVGFSTTGFGLVLLAIAQGYALAVPALVLTGIGMGWLVPAIMAKAVNSVEAGRRGLVVGAVQSASSVAPLVGLTLLEPLLPSIGTRGILLIVGAMSLALFLGFAMRREKRSAATA